MSSQLLNSEVDHQLMPTNAVSTLDAQPNHDDAIVIVGMGCRFPGGANGPDQFWQLLHDGVDAVQEVPADRWSTQAYYAPAPTKPGKTYSRWGGFIDGVDRFDSEFFGISPREAAFVDPQQRLLLEVAWEALENAGIPCESLAGRSVGVFVGASSSDYLQLQNKSLDARLMNAYTNAGGALSIVANRISYLFDLRGPSITIDTACSSSLVAMHYACESLARGESEAALVGGVNVLLWQAGYVGFSQAHMLSPTGRCRSFDANGNGYVRSEGAGVLVLKKMKQAIEDGDQILAVVLGSGVNQDGRTKGMSLPNEEAQAALLEHVYRQAKVDPQQVSFVEAHGTGTTVGDPIEASAIGQVLGRGRNSENQLRIGSVKANIGHLEPASGVAGVIKTILAMKHRELPKNLHFDEPNPAIDFDDLKLRVVSEREKWSPSNGYPRIAGVNSFGFGGTNAHVILREPFGTEPETKQPEEAKPSAFETNGSTSHPLEDPSLALKPTPPPKSVLIPISARSGEALEAAVKSWSEWLNEVSESEAIQLDDIAFNAALRRDHHAHRVSVAARSKAHLQESLNAWLNGERRKEVNSGQKVTAEETKTVFTFSGMGSQWQGMGQELLDSEPTFRAVVEEVDAIFKEISGWSIIDRLNDDEFRSRINEADVAQPCIFAVQVGLNAMWQQSGIVPDVVVGHSVGEAAAAYASGVLSLEDAVRVIYHRSRLQNLLRGQGRMIAAGLPRDIAEKAIERFNGAVSIAAINSPTSVTFSGDDAALEELHHELDAQQTFCRFLKVDIPYHSHQMEEIREELLESLKDLKQQKPTIPYCSTVTGEIMSDPQLDAEYWYLNVREPVLFARAMENLLADHATTFVEVGSHPVLMHSILECSAGQKGIVAVPSMRREEPQQKEFLSSLGNLFVRGASLQWKSLNPTRKQVVKLPNYAWQREVHWCEPEADRRARLQNGGSGAGILLGSPFWLLGQSVESAHQEKAWHVQLSVDAEHLWLADHCVQGVTVFPAAGYVDQALSAGQRLHPEQSLRLESVVISKAVTLPANRATAVETVVDALSGDFYINSHDGQDSWTRHAWGRVVADYSEWNSHEAEFAEYQQSCTESHDTTQMYEWFASLGLEYGPNFQAIDSVATAPGLALGQLRLPETLVPEIKRFSLCPSLFDASLQLTIAATGMKATNLEDGAVPLYLPSYFESIRINDAVSLADQSKEGLWAGCRIVEQNEDFIRADITLFDTNGKAVVVIEGFEAKAFPTSRQEAITLGNSLYDHRWKLQSRTGEAMEPCMPTPSELVSEINARLGDDSPLAELASAEDPELQEKIELQATGFACAAIRELGGDWNAGRTVSVEDLAQELSISNERLSLFDDVLKRLEKSGILKRKSDQVEFVTLLPQIDVRQVWQEICKRHSDIHSEQLLAWQFGSKLSAILRGDEPAEPQFALLEQTEQDGPSFRGQGAMLREVFATLRHMLPAERPLRICEVGAGTTAMASCVIPTLHPQLTDYLFADACSDSVQSAQQAFRSYPFVRFQELDTEQTQPGLEDSHFDVLICSDEQVASQCVSVLADRGLVLLRNGPKRYSINDDGSRYFALRVSESPAERQASLESKGFGKVGECSQGNVTFWFANPPRSEANSTTEPEPETETSTLTWWLVADSLQQAAPLAERLKQTGGNSVTITPDTKFRELDSGFALPFGDADALSELLSLTKSQNAIPNAIIHLNALGFSSGDDVSTEVLRNQQEVGTNMVLALAQACAKANWPRSPRLWTVTKNVHSTGLPEGSALCMSAAPIVGLLRVLSNEFPMLKCTLVDVSDIQNENEIDSLFMEICVGEPEQEVLIRDRQRFVPRLEVGHITNKQSVPESYRVAVRSRGSLDSIALVPAERKAPEAGEIEIEVVASAVNFKDVAKSLQLLSDETLSETWSGNTLGLECTGRVSKVGPEVTDFQVGDRVVALAADSLRPHVITRSEFAARIPDRLSFRDVAGVPVVFLTAWYGLLRLAHLQKGERVLIHAAAGGVGLAAAQIARMAGAEVFATAGSPFKREYLRAQGINHVFDSRSLSFVDGVRQATNGEGVDVVLNSLAGEAIPASLSLLKPGGRFVEIGKRDIQENVGLGLRAFQNNLSFFGLDLDRLLDNYPDLSRSLLNDMMQQFESGALVPIPNRIFPATRAAEAFRHIAKAKQIGKVVLDMQAPDAYDQIAVSADNVAPQFTADGTFVVTGGLSGFGYGSAKWLVEHGVRNVAVLSRRGLASPDAEAHIQELESLGAKVVVEAVDVSDYDQLKTALESIRKQLPPIHGVFHAAMVLDDVMALHLTPERMENAMAPKAWGAWNLHQLTLSDPIDYFVLYSSATTTFGNPSQANYVAACTFLEQLAQHRKAAGRPATAVSWGAIADVGYLSRHDDVLEHIESRLGFKPMNSQKLLEFLGAVLTAQRLQATLVAINWSQFSPTAFSAASSPRMAKLVQQFAKDSSLGEGFSGQMLKMLQSAPAEERRNIMKTFLIDSLANVLGTSSDKIETDRSLLTMGIDSLMAVELQLGLSRELETEISPMQLLRGPTLEELTDELLAMVTGAE